MLPNWLSLIDVAFAATVLLFAMGGFQKGFAGQVAHVITSLSLVIFLFFAYPTIYTYLGGVFRNMEGTFIMWLILAGLAVLTVVFYMFVNKLLANILKTQISDRSDRAYGFSLGLIRGVVVTTLIMIFLVILDSSGKSYETFRMKSRVGKIVCYDLVPRIQPHMTRSVLEERVNKLREALIYQEDAGVLE
jgi:uncharacterized membrane protein required for colicin V production